MTQRTDTLIQRSIALALSAVFTLAILGSINGLAGRDMASNALLAQQAASAPVRG